MNTCIFGYGSLINRKSTEKALKRQLDLKNMVPAIMIGYKRVWRAGEQLWFEAINQQKTGVFLDIEECEGASINEVLIEVSLAELNQLMIREKNYDCIDVTANVKPQTCRRVFTFISRPEYRITPDHPE